jgi:hypothetical protein
MPIVLNKHHLTTTGIPSNAVYVGRPTKWGNPYVLGKDGNREEVLQKYKEYMSSSGATELWREARKELKGKDLVCWCAPKSCHADILLEIANG